MMDGIRGFVLYIVLWPYTLWFDGMGNGYLRDKVGLILSVIGVVILLGLLWSLWLAYTMTWWWAPIIGFVVSTIFGLVVFCAAIFEGEMI